MANTANFDINNSNDVINMLIQRIPPVVTEEIVPLERSGLLNEEKINQIYKERVQEHIKIAKYLDSPMVQTSYYLVCASMLLGILVLDFVQHGTIAFMGSAFIIMIAAAAACLLAALILFTINYYTYRPSQELLDKITDQEMLVKLEIYLYKYTLRNINQGWVRILLEHLRPITNEQIFNQEQRQERRRAMQNAIKRLNNTAPTA